MNEHRSEFEDKGFGASAPVMKKCIQKWKGLSEKEKNEWRQISSECVPKEDEWVCPIKKK